MELYKITYKDLARNKEIKEYFDNQKVATYARSSCAVIRKGVSGL